MKVIVVKLLENSNFNVDLFAKRDFINDNIKQSVFYLAIKRHYYNSLNSYNKNTKLNKINRIKYLNKIIIIFEKKKTN